MNTIQQAHILLVDDNTDLLRLLEEQLRGAGYQNIRTVQNCAAAQTAFAAEMPELMILDINLPDGDGFSLFRTCGQKPMCRLFSLHGTPMPTACSGWDWAQTIT